MSQLDSENPDTNNNMLANNQETEELENQKKDVC